MSVVDYKMYFAGKSGTPQTITATAASEDVIDLSQTTGYSGAGDKVEAEVVVNTAFDSATNDGTLTIAVQDSADASSFATIESGKAITEATLIKGSRWKVAIPASHRRYLRLYFTVSVGSGNFTAGKVFAYIISKA